MFFRTVCYSESSQKMILLYDSGDVQKYYLKLSIRVYLFTDIFCVLFQKIWNIVSQMNSLAF